MTVRQARHDRRCMSHDVTPRAATDVMRACRGTPVIVALALLALVVWCSPASAQDTEPTPSSPPTEIETDDAGDDVTPPPAQDDNGDTLDDLLGIDDDDADESAADAAEREQQDNLEGELTEQSPVDAFQEAISKMSSSASRLDKSFDPGLGTQRIQEDIIAKLAFLIDKAKEDQQQGAQSSGSSGSRQQQQQQQRSPGKQQRGQQDQNSESERNANAQNEQRNGEPQEGDPPPGQDAVLNPIMEERRSEWGELPQRERDMLLQGRQEKFSSLYERLTREYYRRLAEDDS